MKLSRKFIKNKKLIFVLCLTVILCIGVYCSSSLAKHNSVSSYPDEPIQTDAKNIISATLWTLPKKPEIIKEDTQPHFGLSAKSIWKDSPFVDLKTDMKKLHIDQKYYQYLYNYTYIPVATGKMKLNGDGKSYPYIQSIGAGCGSCETQYITMFIGNKSYTAQSTYGRISPRADGRGFYKADLTADSVSNVEDVLLSRFQWNGNGFSEVGIKTVKVKINAH